VKVLSAHAATPEACKLCLGAMCNLSVNNNINKTKLANGQNLHTCLH